MTAFEVEQLTVRHAGRKLPALQDVSLSLRAGERLLLIGPSGSGKSTLALCLNGIIPHSLESHWEHGRVLVGGDDTRLTSLGSLSRRVGLLFQDPEAQLVMLEVDDEIAFGLENHGVARHEMRARVQDARRTVGLDPRRTPSRLDQLSGGAKQRVCLASLVALAPEILVLDEPTATLDPRGARQVIEAIATLASNRRRSLVLIEHRIDQILHLVDRVAVLDAGGHLALEGNPDIVFLDHADLLDHLGVWTPQLASLARVLDPCSTRVPRSPGEAATFIAASWPLARPSTSSLARPAPPTPPVEPPAPLVTVQDVHYRYPHSTVPALDGVSLTLGAGELVAIVGANAAGKSTLGLLLAGVISPARGAVRLEDRLLSDLPEPDLRRRLAYVFQYPEHQFVAHTVRQELEFSARVHALLPDASNRRIEDALERFGLTLVAAASPYSLSHGQKRRLSVATALISDPDLLVLDEPTFGQDRRHTETLVQLLHALRRRGSTVVIITHDLTLVAEHASRVVALAAGLVHFDGVPTDLFARDDLMDACSLVRPPIAEAFTLARVARSDVPALISLPHAVAAFAALTACRS